MTETIGKKITDLPIEEMVDKDDLLLLGSNGTAALRQSPIRKLLELIYPVGCEFMTTDANFDPSNSFGGTWTREKDVFLYAAGDSTPIGSTGGSKTVTLSIENLPSHVHAQTEHTHGIGSHKHKVTGNVQTGTDGYHYHKGLRVKDAASGTAKYRLVSGDGLNPELTDGAITAKYRPNYPSEHNTAVGEHFHSFDLNITSGDPTSSTAKTATSEAVNTGETGSDHPLSIMPPYKAVYIWRRVS